MTESRESILEEAQRLIHGDRNVAYGHPRDNFAAIAAQWNAYLDHMGDRPLNPLDVANLMVLLKVARVVNGVYHRDSYTDMCGYAGTGERLQEPVLVPRPTGGSFTVTVDGDTQEYDHTGARRWDSIVDVPRHVSVVDKDGDVWHRRLDGWYWSVKSGHDLHAYDESGPFTEILGPPPTEGNA